MTLLNALGTPLAWAVLLTAIAGALAATGAAFFLWRRIVRPGHLPANWRPAWVALLLLVVWVDAVTVAYFGLANHTAAVMLSAAWATVALAWAAIAAGNARSARHTVAASTHAAPPDSFERARERIRHARMVYASTTRSI